MWTIKNGELDGISLDQYLGVITGTPTSLVNNAQIIVEATNSGGSNSTTVFISVVEDEDKSGAVHTDADGDGISDAVDKCPLTPTNAQVDDNGCEIIEYTTDSDDDGNKLDLSVVGCLGKILGLLGVLVMLVFFRDREASRRGI